ncbi:MAG: glucose-1-phosphate cytidylyltransferase [Acidobacteria bacterium]|nr:glucose-1-phosphate cytidylyltransferase [Acidobacteriota bacterium]
MKVVILCGGMGFRLREETELRPKPMVEIGGKPILWHIMQTYSAHGFHDFILCLGYKGEVIKQYFLNYAVLNSSFTLRLRDSRRIQFHSSHKEENWTVTLADTGIHTMTGSRVKQIEPFIGKDSDFMLTYGDGVSDIDLKALVRFHKAHGKIGTITGVPPLSRFGELVTEKRSRQVLSFAEKPLLSDTHINGGFFVFKKEFLAHLSPEEDCVLEEEPLARLAKYRQLMMYSHPGYWQCMDTYRDYKQLNEMWEGGQARWKVWR